MSANSSDREQPININISKSGDSSDKYNAFKEYLIINNLDLQAEIKDLKNHVNVLQIEINEKEITEDKTDSSVRYLRGLVNNLNEIKKGYISISKDREHLVNNTNREWNDICKISENYNLQLLLSNVIFIIWNIILRMMTYTRFRYMINITMNIMIIYAIGHMYYNYYKTVCACRNNIKNKNDTLLIKIKDATTDLTKLEESTLALDSWIYEV